jgi:hypothetical protein
LYVELGDKEAGKIQQWVHQIICTEMGLQDQLTSPTESLMKKMTVNPIISSLLDSDSLRRTTIVVAAQENNAGASTG